MTTGLSVIPLSDLDEPFYTGSVQKLYACPGREDWMVSETTAGGSVFDVGTIFEIGGSDVGRALFRHVAYSRLADPATWKRVKGAILADEDLGSGVKERLVGGAMMDRLLAEGARTHHVGMLDVESGEVRETGVPAHHGAMNVVRRFSVHTPEVVSAGGASLYDYSPFPAMDGYVVPLEVIVRFGLTSSSSVFTRYQGMGDAGRKALAADLGVSEPLEAWAFTDAPILDFTSKYEPTDRAVTRQEALNMSGLGGERFGELSDLAVLGGWAMRLMFSDIGLQLWDLKWEFAVEGGDLFFVDTIDTDSVRATVPVGTEEGDAVVHINKQAMRDYYRIQHPKWVADVETAKREGKASGLGFQAELKQGQVMGRFEDTPEVDAAFLKIQEDKVEAVSDYLSEGEAPLVVRDRIGWIAEAEIRYYEEAGKLKEYLEINGV